MTIRRYRQPSCLLDVLLCRLVLVVCRDGLERVQVADRATLRELRQQISASLNIPEDSVVLSTDPKLVS